jgi:hypothetical protein
MGFRVPDTPPEPIQWGVEWDVGLGRGFAQYHDRAEAETVALRLRVTYPRAEVRVYEIAAPYGVRINE